MTQTIVSHILQRLEEFGVDTLFGIPGTSCAAVFDEAASRKWKTVLNSSELDAGYAADGYARLKKVAAVSVSYGVGTMSLVNTIAGSFVERSAVVVINGGPSTKELWNEKHFGILYSHSTGRDFSDLKIFSEVTAYAARIEDTETAADIIDAAISTAIREQRPVYIEVPNDMWNANCTPEKNALSVKRHPVGDETRIAKEIFERLSQAEAPAFLLGVEIERFDLQDDVENLIRSSAIPWATTLLSKSVLEEDFEGFSGVYDSDLAPKPVRRVVEQADTLLSLGCVFGVDHTRLLSKNYNNILHVADGYYRDANNVPRRADLRTVIQELEMLFKADDNRPTLRTENKIESYSERRAWANAAEPEGLGHDVLYKTIDGFLSEEWIIVHDTCLGSYPSADLKVHGRSSFVACPVWLSIGHSIGASIGVGLADMNRRPLVICGDGGFQITAPGLSALARYNIPAVVIIIDNGLYAIEQYLLKRDYFDDDNIDPLPYVELHRWNYTELAKSMGFENVVKVDTQEELDQALRDARSWSSPGLISVTVRSRDLPPENKEI